MKQIIKKPVVSEKSFTASGRDKFTFLADPKADKETIKTVVEGLYGVSVIKVNTQNVNGKIKRVKGKNGTRDDYKKTVVTLKAGQKIALFEVESDDAKDAKKDAKAAKKEKKSEVSENKDVTTIIKKKSK